MSELSGSQLKSIREERHIPLEQVASATRIRLSLLEALEADEYADLGSRTQARGFLKIYADFLGVALETPAEAPNPALPEETAIKPDTSALTPQTNPVEPPENPSKPTEPKKTGKSKPAFLPKPSKSAKKPAEKPEIGRAHV